MTNISNKFYQRRTMRRIPRTPAEAERFLWHAMEYISHHDLRLTDEQNASANTLLREKIAELQEVQQ